jgi:hypothetical protein
LRLIEEKAYNQAEGDRVELTLGRERLFIQLSNSKRFLSALVENVGFSSMVATVTTTSSWANAKLIPWESLR